jgi:DNA-binding IclR family transcriptional regulator
MKRYDQGMSDWTLLTNHAHVLICIAREPGYRLREIADCVGLTERATHRLVDDLVKADYLTRHRLGNRSFYEVHADRPLRHDLVEHAEVGDILAPLLARSASARS